MNNDYVVAKFSEALSNGNGAFFIGSGTSVPSGLPSWSDLLKKYCGGVYAVAKHIPLPLVAQYMVLESGGNDSILKTHVSEMCRTAHKVDNVYLKHICRASVNRIWTTNYDTLIESAFHDIGCTVNYTDHCIDKGADLNTVEIIKMHGCRTDTSSMILTQDDYDFYQKNHPNTCRRLLSDMSERVFLFIGYGYNDPNIHNIIRTSQWNGRTTAKQHFLISKRDRLRPDLQDLWARNLARFGILVCFIEEHSELEVLLEKIALKSRGKRVYVTGSHSVDPSVLAAKLGEQIALKDELILLDGQPTGGVGADTLDAFSTKCREKLKDKVSRIESFHNPYAVNSDFTNDPSLMPNLKAHRIPLFRKAQLVILFDGGMGTRAEFELALELGCNILPVPVIDPNTLKYSDFMTGLVLASPNVLKYLNNFPIYLEKLKSGKQIEWDDLLSCVKLAFKLL